MDVCEFLLEVDVEDGSLDGVAGYKRFMVAVDMVDDGRGRVLII